MSQEIRAEKRNWEYEKLKVKNNTITRDENYMPSRYYFQMPNPCFSFENAL